MRQLNGIRVAELCSKKHLLATCYSFILTPQTASLCSIKFYSFTRSSDMQSLISFHDYFTSFSIFLYYKIHTSLFDLRNILYFCLSPDDLASILSQKDHQHCRDQNNFFFFFFPWDWGQNVPVCLPNCFKRVFLNKQTTN